MAYVSRSGLYKGRFRSGFPGRNTEAQAQALLNSLRAAPTVGELIPAQASLGDGDARHQARMAALQPQELIVKAKRLGYEPLEISAPIPTEAPAAPMAAIAERGAVVLATAAPASPRKQKRAPLRKRSDTVITVIPEASVVPHASAVASEAPATDFCAFLEHYAAHKAHGKDSTLLEYLKRQYESGATYNPATKRFTKGFTKGFTKTPKRK